MNVDWNKIRVVSWDVDGTLYNIPKMKVLAFLTMLPSLLFGPLRSGLREIRAIFAFRDRMRAIRLAGGDLSQYKPPIERAELLEYSSRWWAPATGKAGLRKGVREFITALESRGIRQVVLSDYYSDAKLRVLGVHESFHTIYAAEEIGHLKPSTVPFEAVLRDQGIQPDEMLHIGDRDDTDGIGARNAGVPTLIIGQDFKRFSALTASLQNTPVKELESPNEAT